MDIRKPLYIHIVTALAAASIAALPQSAFNRALRALTVALMVGAGGTAASEIAQSSVKKEIFQSLYEELRLQEQRIEELSRQIQEGEKELSRLREELQQRSGQLQELGARLAERHQLLQQLQDRDQRVQSLQAEIEELQNQLFQREEEIEELRAEQQRKDEEIKELKDRIKGFQDTVYTTSKGTGHYRSCNPSETDIILKTNETEFYPQEAKSFILEILHRAIDQAYEESRVRHILEDLIQHNDAQEGNRHRQDIMESINDLFLDYRKWNDSYKRKLQRLGFQITSEDNHVKIRFYGDPRYQIVIAKTPSDRRAGLNISRDIRNIIFGL